MITPSYGLTATERVLPSFTLDWTTGLVQSTVDVTRAGAATVFNASGNIVDALADTQRIDYSTGVAGLLVEESRVNELTDTKGMTIANAAISAGQVADSAGDPHFGYFDSGIYFDTPSATTTYYKQYTFTSLTGVFSFFIVMDDGGEPMPGGVVSSSDDFGIIFDGSVVTSGFNKTNLGNGKWRIDLPRVDTSYNNGFFGLQCRAANSGRPFTVYGYQLEAGAFPTSYIPTEASAVTRNADVATVTGTNFSDWFNPTEGTFASRFVFGGDTISTRVAVASDGTFNNYLGVIGSTGGGTGPYFGIGASGVTQTTVPSPAVFSTYTEYSVCGAYKANDCAGAKDGAAVAVDTTATIPTVDRLEIGSIAGANFLNGHILQVQYWSLRLTNNEVRAFSK